MMKSDLKFKGVLILTALLAIFLTACGGGSSSSDNVVTSHTVSGTVTLPASVNAKPWYVAIDDDLDGGNGMIAETTGVVTGSTFSYSIHNVPSGDYYVYGEVDLTGEKLGPLESGDYVGFGCGTIDKTPS
jgi:ABC-type Fe3+-hydroxamate transport system substrate-binding protein